MASPEYSHPDNAPDPTHIELAAALADVERRLEKADENENTIERFFKRDALLEERDSLQAEIDMTTSLPEHPEHAGNGE